MQRFNLKNYHDKNIMALFNWRNDKMARQNSLNKKIILFKDHKNWIKKNTIYNKKNRIYIFYLFNKPIGMCAILKKKKFYYLNYSIDRKYRNKGFSSIMLKMLIKKIKNYLNEKNIYALVLTNNVASYNVLRRLNFFILQKNKKYMKLQLSL